MKPDEEKELRRRLIEAEGRAQSMTTLAGALIWIIGLALVYFLLR